MRILSRLSCAACAAGVLCGLAAQISAQEEGGTVNCEISYTDCIGMSWNPKWTCATNSQCCVTRYMNPGSDGEPGGGDDCIIEAEIGCAGADDGCVEEVWVSSD